MACEYGRYVIRASYQVYTYQEIYSLEKDKKSKPVLFCFLLLKKVINNF